MTNVLIKRRLDFYLIRWFIVRKLEQVINSPRLGWQTGHMLWWWWFHNILLWVQFRGPWFSIAFKLFLIATGAQSNTNTSRQKSLVVRSKAIGWMNGFITVFAEECSVLNTEYESCPLLHQTRTKNEKTIEMFHKI